MEAKQVCGMDGREHGLLKKDPCSLPSVSYSFGVSHQLTCVGLGMAEKVHKETREMICHSERRHF